MRGTMGGLQIRGSLLARNTILNFIGQVIPLLVGIVTIPYVIRGLGVERFGILSLIWVFLGYVSLFDFGLGLATTKFAAECLGRGEVDDLSKWVWTSLGIQVLFGVGGGLLIATFAPLLVEEVLTISPLLAVETKSSFFIVGAFLPFVVATAALRGVLEAGQRFDLVNYVNIPASVSMFLLPAFAVPLDLRLPGIVLLLAAARAVAMLAYLFLSLRLFPSLRKNLSFDATLVRPLMTYGGWVTVSNVVSPLLTHMDRFFIGSRFSMAAVAYYTAPYEAVTRLAIFPRSLVRTLFPAFSSLGASNARESLGQIFIRSVKYLLLVLGPFPVLIVVFAPEILGLWLGAEFAEKSTLVLQILAVGVFANSLAFIPFGLLQGLGRPDLTAKFHLVELPLYAGLLWFLVGDIGIAGAALAWTLRVGVDAILLYGASWWFKFVPAHDLEKRGFVRSIFAFLALTVLLPLTALTAEGLLLRVFLAMLLIALFAVVTWRYALDEHERILVTSVVGQGLHAFRGVR